jgi:hypothetical protein
MILDGWGVRGTCAARTSLRLDRLLIPSYVIFIAAMSLLFTVLSRGRAARAGPWVAMAVVLAGALDLVENHALGRIIDGQAHLGDGLPLVAGMAASLKLGIVLPAALYVLSALVAVVLARRGTLGVSASAGRSGPS